MTGFLFPVTDDGAQPPLPFMRCPDHPNAPTRWLVDEEGLWAPGEEPILICCECGGDAEPAK